MSSPEAHAVEQERDVAAKARPVEPETAAPTREGGAPAVLGALQRSAGNAAVNHLLRQYAQQSVRRSTPASLLSRHTLGSTLARSALPQQEPTQESADQAQPTPEETAGAAPVAPRAGAAGDGDGAPGGPVQARHAGLPALQRSETDTAAVQHSAAASEEAEAAKADAPGGLVQATAEVGLAGGPLSPDLSGRITARRGAGAPLDEPTRTGMERAFGTSLGDVRVHTDGEADTLNRSVSAKAFTTGSDIFFSAGTYAPGTGDGNRLLGHELTHVVQQRTMGGGGSGTLTVGPAGDSHEQEADATGAAAAAALESGPATAVSPAPGVGSGAVSRLIARSAVVQRQGHKGAAVKTTFTVKNASTTVDGQTLQDVVDAVGDGEAGATDWAPTYTVTKDGNGTVTGVSVDVPITVTLPTWSGLAKAGKRAKAEWNRFVQALRKHEDGHVKLVKDKLKGVAQQMVGKSEADAQALWDAALADLQQDSDAYDAANDHGRNEGTIIDTSLDDTKPAPVQPARDLPPVARTPLLIQRAVAYDKAPASPAEDPAYQAVIGKVKGVAKTHKTHEPATQKAAQAQAASVSPPSELASTAAANQTEKMAQQQPKPFDKAAFKHALEQKIAELAPKNLDEMDKFKDSGKVGQMHGALGAQVGQGKKDSSGGMEQTTKQEPSTAGVAPKPVTPLPAADGASSPAVDAKDAAPKPKSEQETSLKEGGQQLDQQMAQGGVTDEQLKKSNEPQFQQAVDAKATAHEHAEKAPQDYRKSEQGILAQGQAEAQAAAQTGTAAMHGVATQAHGQVHGQQGTAKAKDEEARAKVAADIHQIYDQTKKTVEDRLARLDKEVDDTFDRGAKAAQDAFANGVKADIDAYKDKRYSGVTGAALWVEDAFTGLPSEANQFYDRRKAQFIKDMDGVLDRVTDVVATGLTEAKAAIAEGKSKVDAYVKSRPASLQRVAQQAAADIQGQFSALEQSVDDKQNQLVDSLANKYNEKLKAVDDQITAMKAENKGLVDKAAEAIGGVIETIKQLKDMLTGVLARAANAIDLIIKDPIGFLGNLVAGVKQGFDNFVANIWQHLKAGFMAWLFGAVAEAGIQMPESFDLKGILSLVLQVLGLTWANIRGRAVSKVGEKVMKALEGASEIFQIVMTQGPAGLWEWIKEKIGDLKAMVVDQIKNFIVEKVVVAGITWLIGLLNPASAFIKACKAIYDIVMFFIERGSQIMALVNAIVDSVTAIAQGNIGGAAAFVEQSLAKAIPVVISFLAALLGVGGISEKIKSVIQQIQAPINKAIDWVVDKAIGLVKAAGKLLGFGGKDKKDTHGPDTRSDAEKDADEAKAKAKVEPLVQDESKTADDVKLALPAIKAEFKLTTLEMKEEPEGEGKEKVTVEGMIQRMAVSGRKPAHVSLSPTEATTVAKLPGGQDLLDKLPGVNPDKQQSLISEARIALDAIARGEPIIAIGKEVPRGVKGKGLLTEIDVETENEMIQVKGGDYSAAKKLSDEDQTQWNATRKYNEQMRFAPDGTKLAPKKIVFHFTNPPVDPRLVAWLQSRSVEVRLGQR